MRSINNNARGMSEWPSGSAALRGPHIANRNNDVKRAGWWETHGQRRVALFLISYPVFFLQLSIYFPVYLILRVLDCIVTISFGVYLVLWLF